MIEIFLFKVYEKIEFMLFNLLFCFIMDYNLVDYIMVKNNVILIYKDMSYVNSYGMICGFQFLVFVFQYYGLIFDFLFLGFQCVSEIVGLF